MCSFLWAHILIPEQPPPQQPQGLPISQASETHKGRAKSHSSQEERWTVASEPWGRGTFLTSTPFYICSQLSSSGWNVPGLCAPVVPSPLVTQAPCAQYLLTGVTLPG